MATRAFRVQSSGSRKIAFTILSMRHQYTAVSKTVQIIFGRIVEIACSYACAYGSGATDQRTDADDPIPTSLVERTRALRGRKRIEKFRRAEVEGRRANRGSTQPGRSRRQRSTARKLSEHRSYRARAFRSDAGALVAETKRADG